MIDKQKISCYPFVINGKPVWKKRVFKGGVKDETEIDESILFGGSF